MRFLRYVLPGLGNRPSFSNTNTQGSLPFDDPSVRTLLHKVRSGVFQMPASFSPMARDFIARLLVLDPAKRLTIEGMKAHPMFRLGLPQEYVIPRPLPIPLMQGPIDPATVAADVLDVLHKIGYTDDEELTRDLVSEQQTMAKVFFHMLTARVGIDELDWSRAVGGSSFGQASDAPLAAFTVDGVDPFQRHIGSMPGSSYEAAASLAFRPEWAMPESEPMQVVQTFNVAARMGVVQTMTAVQLALAQLEMQWFHPDDFTVIARHEAMGVYAVCQCVCAPDESESAIQIQLCHGTPESFSVLCQTTEELIHTVEAGLPAVSVP